MEWTGFVTSHADKLRVGFRPTQVEADVALDPMPSGDMMLRVRDRSVYASDDDANHRTQIKTYVFLDLAAY